MSNRTYRLYPKAIDDLESIYVYSLGEFGRNRTEDYIRMLELSFQHLADDPLIARLCEDIRPDLRAFNVGSHIIFFKIIADNIAIIRVLHQSMDFNRHI
ncbi:MAG: type II toxin-antitoxin system RelE/ParE family toxin [Legionella sp.]|nr:type II toxin-antitoxin system RelE/ParE family toxin [Legionella sp.]